MKRLDGEEMRIPTTAPHPINLKRIPSTATHPINLKRIPTTATQPINLKDLPPIDPATATGSQINKKDKQAMKYFPKGAKGGPKEELNLGKKFDDEANTTADLLADINLSHHIKTEADCNTIIKNTTKVGEISNDDKASRNDSAGPKISAKSQLLEAFAANKWKAPLFECFEEEGHGQQKLFIYKIVMEIKGEASSTVLECFGDPKSKKKTAAENAAEGALWYLKHVGYFPIKKVKRKK